MAGANRNVADKPNETNACVASGASGEAEELRKRLRIAQLLCAEAEQLLLGFQQLLDRTEQQHADELKAQEARAKGYLPYRLGKVLVDSARNPLLWPLVGFRLVRAWLDWRESNRSAAAVTGADDDALELSDHGLKIQALVRICQSEGAEAAVNRVTDAMAARPARARALALLRAGKALVGAGLKETELTFARAALDVDRSDITLRAFFFAARRAHEYFQACDAIVELDRYYGPSPAPEQQEFMQKLKFSPVFTLTVVKEATPATVTRIESVARRLCYVLHNTLPHSSGGYATRSHGIATSMKQAGWDVVVLSRPGYPLDIKPGLSAGQVTPVDELDGIPYVRTLSPLRVGRSFRDYMIGAATAIENRLREYRPSLVMAASNYVTALPALIAARRLGLPFFYEVRGLWEITRMSRETVFQEKPAFHVQKILESTVAQMADHVFTLTEPMREELVLRGVADDKITLLPNSVDPARFTPRQRDDALAASLGIPAGVAVIGYVGTFVDYEGLEDLALACGLLKQSGVEFRLLLIGNENASAQDRGPITQEIVRIAGTIRFSDWLIMPGRVPHEQVERYYSLIDVAPFPRKPWPVCEMVSPLKPLEALAMEKAVVVSSVRALTEMIREGETGLVFEKGRVESLAEKLKTLIENPTLRVELGKRGRAWVSSERTWAQAGRRFDELASRPLGSVPGAAAVDAA